MNLSAILVVARSDRITAVCDDLGAMKGVEVHHIDAATGRAILTQEAFTVDEEVDGLRRIQEHPSIALAEMVEHHFDHESQPPESGS